MFHKECFCCCVCLKKLREDFHNYNGLGPFCQQDFYELERAGLLVELCGRICVLSLSLSFRNTIVTIFVQPGPQQTENMRVYPIPEVATRTIVSEDTVVHAYLVQCGKVVLGGFLSGDNVVIPAGGRFAKFDKLILNSLEVIRAASDYSENELYYIQFTTNNSFVPSKPFVILPGYRRRRMELDLAFSNIKGGIGEGIG